MTIREIARLAQVSPSTVSKIINHKDATIRPETRDRVLRIVEEHRYVPYAKHLSSGSHLIGLILTPATDYRLVTGVITGSKAMGYGVIVCTAASPEEFRDAVDQLNAHHVGGVLSIGRISGAEALGKQLADVGLPYLKLDNRLSPSPENVAFSGKALGRSAAAALTGVGHRRIGCVLEQEELPLFLDGVREAMNRQGLSFEATDVLRPGSEKESLYAWLPDYTALICGSEALAATVLTAAEHLNIRVPADLSLVLVPESTGERSLSLSTLVKPYEQLGAFAARRLINTLQGQTAPESFHSDYPVDGPDSILPPRSGLQGNIVVVGSVNTDTLIPVADHPLPGETVNVRGSWDLPGGKGLNQAVAAVRLGAAAHLIGCLGTDYNGRQVHAFLKSTGVDMGALRLEDKAPTGHAYIYIQKDAESSIVVTEGANRLLSRTDIDAAAHLLQEADYCLLHTETAVELVEYAALLAKKSGARVILKPCSVSRLPQGLLKLVNILVPNAREADRLLPGLRDTAAQAARFCELGAGEVIITLGSQGCYHYRDGVGRSYPALDVPAVDTTGAADAFIATLSVYLSRGLRMEQAIPYATCAAGLVTTRHGVPTALADQNTLEMYVAQAERSPV